MVYITFRSVTMAMRATQVLRDVGITGAMVRTPQVLRRRGCGYSLRLQERSLPTALQTLKNSETVYGGAFRRMADGTWQEVAV